MRSKLKNRKAPGPDGVTNEMLGYGGDILAEEINLLFNKILTQAKIPEQWKESITIPLFKKGIKTDPNNFWGISILSSVAINDRRYIYTLPNSGKSYRL